MGLTDLNRVFINNFCLCVANKFIKNVVCGYQVTFLALLSWLILHLFLKGMYKILW